MDPRKWLGAASLIGVAPEWLVIMSSIASDMGGFAWTLAKSAKNWVHLFESEFTLDGLLRILDCRIARFQASFRSITDESL